jgi:hypothetical protein
VERLTEGPAVLDMELKAETLNEGELELVLVVEEEREKVDEVRVLRENEGQEVSESETCDEALTEDERLDVGDLSGDDELEVLTRVVRD